MYILHNPPLSYYVQLCIAPTIFRIYLMTQDFNESDTYTSKCRHFEPTYLKYNILFTTFRNMFFS